MNLKMLSTVHLAALAAASSFPASCVLNNRHKPTRGHVTGRGPVLSGSYKPLTVGRNDPCPCGSGKKAKKCWHIVESR